MAKAKRREMTAEGLELVASIFRVLSEPLRLRILHALEEGEMSVSAVTEEVDSTQPNVSKHLKTLQEAGLLRRRQAGNTVYYSIADEVVFVLCDTVCDRVMRRLATQAGALGARLHA
jgi:DNA-binding transcriptional ArsR family regulator